MSIHTVLTLVFLAQPLALARRVSLARSRARAHRSSRATPKPPSRRVDGDSGMATAEYAVMIVVACGFAIVMSGIVHSATVRDLLTGIVRRALSQSF
jgi:hypothetical protein